MENQNEPQKKKWYKRWWAIVIYIFIFLLVIGGLQDYKKGNKTNQTADNEPAKTVSNEKQISDTQSPSIQEQKKVYEYEIVKKDVYDATKDYVEKANAEKQGVGKTIANMPLFKEEKLKVLIPSGLSEDDIKNTVRKIYQDETKSDGRLDRVTVTAYNSREDIESSGSYVSHSYWEKSNEKLNENDKDSFNGGRINWSYVEKQSTSVSSGDASDQDRKIYYRYVELMNSRADVPLSEVDAQSDKDYEAIGKELGISVEEARKASDRFFESKPTERDIQIAEASDGENDRQVAKQYGITENEVKAINLFVFHWESKQPL